MLTATTKEHEEGITTAHRAKRAYVYIRQSTAGQVRQHQESTQLQYRLVSRAASLGWPRDRVEVYLLTSSFGGAVGICPDLASLRKFDSGISS